MRIFADEESARTWMRSHNTTDLTWVLVDGPKDDEFTVMTLRDAVDGGFLYWWEASALPPLRSLPHREDMR